MTSPLSPREPRIDAEGVLLTRQQPRRWVLLGRFVLRRADGQIYLKRRRIVQTPWFGVYYHRITSADPGYDLHDHPWAFASIVLSGGYVEERCPTHAAVARAQLNFQWPETFPRGDVRRRRAGSCARTRLGTAHRITRLLRPASRTLVFVGPRHETWGFYTPQGFLDHKLYDVENNELQISEGST